MMRRYLFLLTTIILSFVTLYATFMNTSMIVRPVIVIAFLLVCPGITLMQFLNLKNIVAECTLGVALSLAFNGSIATLFLYAGKWFPNEIMFMLAMVTLIAALSYFLWFLVYDRKDSKQL